MEQMKNQNNKTQQGELSFVKQVKQCLENAFAEAEEQAARPKSKRAKRRQLITRAIAVLIAVAIALLIHFFSSPERWLRI